MRMPQGVASLALGWVLHWAFSPRLLNLKLELLTSAYDKASGELGATRQPVNQQVNIIYHFNTTHL